MDLILELLLGVKFEAGQLIWNAFMDMVKSMLTMTPAEYAPEAWNFAVSTVYPWILGLSVMVMNILFLVGLLRQATNLRQNMTLEGLVEIFIKLVAANAVMQSGLVIMDCFFRISSAMVQQADYLAAGDLSIRQTDVDIGSTLFYWALGLIYIIVSFICGLMIFMAVFGRYIQIYLLVVTAPVALATAVGGTGISHTMVSWVKTFLSKCFEVVVIMLVLVLASKMSMQIDFATADGGVLQWVDGAFQAMANMMLMIIVTASVKGADSFMRRAFGL